MERKKEDDAVSVIETEMSDIRVYLDGSTKRLESIIGRIIQGLEADIFPDFVKRRIDLLMRENADRVLRMSEEDLGKLKAELKEAISKSIVDVIGELRRSKEWFTCEEEEKLRSYGIRLSSDLWKIFQSIDKPIAPVLQKHGLDVYLSSENRTDDRTILKPINWSWFITFTASKELEDLNTVLANEKTEYCKRVRSLQELEEEQKKEKALRKWRTVG